MAYSYDPTLLERRDQVRFLAQDNRGEALARLADEEIDWILTQSGNVYLAAAQAAGIIAAYYADQVDKTVGSLRISASRRAEAYLKLADKLEASASAGGRILPKPWAASTSQSTKNARRQDGDRTKPAFYEEMMEDPTLVGNEPDRRYLSTVPFPE